MSFHVDFKEKTILKVCWGLTNPIACKHENSAKYKHPSVWGFTEYEVFFYKNR